jgi:hypothetical protein
MSHLYLATPDGMTLCRVNGGANRWGVVDSVPYIGHTQGFGWGDVVLNFQKGTGKRLTANGSFLVSSPLYLFLNRCKLDSFQWTALNWAKIAKFDTPRLKERFQWTALTWEFDTPRRLKHWE